ncbi:MAG: hypothetical protein RJQ09_07415 [Cyclobacteriaceae bacterium]
MSKTNLMNSAIVPNVGLVYFWDKEGRTIKEIVLRNSFASTNDVSAMTLNTYKLSAIDQSGQEHFVKDFPGQKSLEVEGMSVGKHIISRSLVNLEKGIYKTLRFYLDDDGGHFTYSDRSNMTIKGCEYLDFEIKKGLTIGENEASHLMIRFDLPYYQFWSFLKPLKQFFGKASNRVGGLAGA